MTGIISGPPEEKAEGTAKGALGSTREIILTKSSEEINKNKVLSNRYSEIPDEHRKEFLEEIRFF